jgi:hypothetical protein
MSCIKVPFRDGIKDSMESGIIQYWGFGPISRYPGYWDIGDLGDIPDIGVFGIPRYWGIWGIGVLGTPYATSVWTSANA